MARASGKSKKISKMQILAWISYAFAIAAAVSLPGMFLGQTIAWTISHVWGWVGPLLLLGAIACVALDIAVDLTPNRLAVWFTMVIPSIAAGMGGGAKHAKVAALINRMSHAILGWVNSAMGEWIGTTSVVGVALGAGLAAWIIARRTMPAKGGAAA